MATTNLLNNVQLENGDESAEVTIAESSERVNLRLQSVQVGSQSSQARLVCTDDEGRVKKTTVVDGDGLREVEIEAIDGPLTCQVACNLGTCRVTLDEVTGSEGATGEGPGAVSATDLADGSIATAKLAAGAVTGPKVDLSSLVTHSAVGVNSSGGDTNITVTGVTAGDRVIAAFSAPTAGGALIARPIGTHITAVAPANDAIEQLQAAADLTGHTLVFLVLPAAS